MNGSFVFEAGPAKEKVEVINGLCDVTLYIFLRVAVEGRANLKCEGKRTLIQSPINVHSIGNIAKTVNAAPHLPVASTELPFNGPIKGVQCMLLHLRPTCISSIRIDPLVAV